MVDCHLKYSSFQLAVSCTCSEVRYGSYSGCQRRLYVLLVQPRELHLVIQHHEAAMMTTSCSSFIIYHLSSSEAKRVDHSSLGTNTEGNNLLPLVIINPTSEYHFQKYFFHLNISTLNRRYTHQQSIELSKCISSNFIPRLQEPKKLISQCSCSRCRF